MNMRFGSFMALIGLILVMVGAASASSATASPPAVVQATSVGSGFTYQGELKNANGPVNATCAFQFALYDAASGGTQVGTTLSQNVQVADGLFTVQLDFGANTFNGASHWLQIAVQCPGDTGFTVLTPRQQLTAVPYALSLMPGATISGSANVGLTVENTASSPSTARNDGSAIVAAIEASIAAKNGTAVAGRSPVGVGVQGESADGTGVQGESTNGVAVRGRSPVVAVQGESTDGTGVQGESTNGVAVRGRSPVVAVQGESTDGTGVYGESTSGSAVEGLSYSGYGVVGISQDNTNSGVYGNNSASGPGVIGTSSSGDGVYGWSNNRNGVYGLSGDQSGFAAGVYGDNDRGGLAGWFNGDVFVNGTLSKAAGAFKIDHPLDPANKYLSHSFVESPDMKNIYDGVVTTDGNGEAVVELPAYFGALNRDFRYQLTVIGAFAQAIVASEIADNRFTIKTDKPNVKVSWQVTGIRQDAYANANRIVVEEDKPAAERGTYLHPTEQGQPESKGLGYEQRQAMRQNLQSAVQQSDQAAATERR